MAVSAINGALSVATAATRVMSNDLPALADVGSADGAAAREGFGDQVVGALERLNQMHTKADGLAIQAATGDLNDVHEYTIAATQAELATQLTVAVRDKALAAFNDIMRMQV